MSGQAEAEWSVFGQQILNSRKVPLADTAAEAWTGAGAAPGRTGSNISGVTVHEAMVLSSTYPDVVNVSGTESSYTQRVDRPSLPWTPCAGTHCDGRCAGEDSYVSGHSARALRRRGHAGPDESQNGQPAADYADRVTGSVISTGPMPSGQYRQMSRLTSGVNSELRRSITASQGGVSRALGNL